MSGGFLTCAAESLIHRGALLDWGLCIERLRQGANEIGARDDADELSIADHGHPLDHRDPADPALGHQLDGIEQ